MRPSNRAASRVPRLLVAAAASACLLIAGCGERDVTDQREDSPKDSPTTAQRPPSTGVPDGSTTSSTEPGDGSLDPDGSTTTVSGAQPGRPQLDAEPTPEPSG